MSETKNNTLPLNEEEKETKKSESEIKKKFTTCKKNKLFPIFFR